MAGRMGGPEAPSEGCPEGGYYSCARDLFQPAELFEADLFGAQKATSSKRYLFSKGDLFEVDVSERYLFVLSSVFQKGTFLKKLPF